MKTMSQSIAILVVLAAAGTPVVTFGHGPTLQLAIVGHQVVTTHFFLDENSSYLLNGTTFNGANYNPLYVGESARIAHVPMVRNADNTTTFGITNNGWYGQASSESAAAYTGPGISYGGSADLNGNAAASGFVAGSKITQTLVGPLQVWNGSAFVVSTANRLQGIRGNLGPPTASSLFTSPTGAESGSWSTTPSTITPGSHNQVEWRLDKAGTQVPDVAPADGIFLATLTVGSNQLVDGQSVANSLPFYFLFEKNAGSVDATEFAEQVAAADSFVQSSLIPEPSQVGLMCMAACVVARRRR